MGILNLAGVICLVGRMVQNDWLYKITNAYISNINNIHICLNLNLAPNTEYRIQNTTINNDKELYQFIMTINYTSVNII